MKKSLLIVFLIFMIACNAGAAIANPTPVVSKGTGTSVTRTPSATLTEIELPAGYGTRGPWFELYFTNPASSLAPQLTGGPDGPLAQAIDAARLSVDLA